MRSDVYLFGGTPTVPLLPNPTMPLNLKVPFSQGVTDWVWEAARKNMSPSEIAMTLLIAELTGSEPDSVRQRFVVLEAECKKIIYRL